MSDYNERLDQERYDRMEREVTPQEEMEQWVNQENAPNWWETRP